MQLSRLGAISKFDCMKCTEGRTKVLELHDECCRIKKGGEIMKRIMLIMLCLTIMLCLSSCIWYNPPKGWTKEHHTYAEVLDYAKSIDPNATVKEHYTDFVDEDNWEFREWDAVIKGVDCHVASVSDWVWNSGFGAGEFTKNYYRVDTDYNYALMQNILSEKFQNWEARADIYNRYHDEKTYIELQLSEYRQLDDDELEQVWETALQINKEYEKLAFEQKAEYGIPSPEELYNHHGEEEYFVTNGSYTYIESFTEKGKKAFLKEYRDSWALLDSGLPVYDDVTDDYWCNV